MLDIMTGSAGRMCDRSGRRNFLRVSGAAAAAGLLGHELPGLTAGGTEGSYLRDRSVVLLFLSGGPSQIETFDPKPHGPESSTSLNGHVGTSLPGVRFSAYLPKLASMADRLTVVRNFQTNHAEHNGAHKQLMTGDLTVGDGKPIRDPGLGAICSRAAGAVAPGTGMPTQAVIPPTTRHLPGKSAGFAGSYDSVIEGCQPAWLGAEYAPFETKVPMAEGQPREKKSRSGRSKNEPVENPLIDDLAPRIADLRLDARMDLLRQLDRLERRLDHTGTMAGFDAYSKQAVDLIRGGGVRRALDLNREDPRVLSAYDTEQFRNYRCGENSIFERSGPSIGISLGRQLLMARRLCEAGAKFVTVIHANWDFHARKNIPNMPEGMSVLAPPVDHAVTAFLEDLRQRGLDRKILLAITGEFGRTPKLDENLGRHHWPRICPLVFAGGGLRHGQVVGRSDRRGGEPDGEPYTIADFHTTVLHTLFDVGRMRLDTSLPPEIMARATRGRPIAEMF